MHPKGCQHQLTEIAIPNLKLCIGIVDGRQRKNAFEGQDWPEKKEGTPVNWSRTSRKQASSILQYNDGDAL